MLRLRRHTYLTVALLLVALALLVSPVAANTEDSGTLVVTGRAEITAEPDMALFNIGVNVLADSVAEARQANADAMQRIRTRLLASGAREADLQTNGFNVHQEWQYNRDDGSRTLVGYRVTHTLEVRVLELERLGDWLDAAMADGANEVSGLRFGVTDTKRLEAEALAEAVRHARRKAEVVAEASGVFLKGVAHISEQVTQPPTLGKEVAFSAAMAAADRAATPISAGEISVHATVTISYRI